METFYSRVKLWSLITWVFVIGYIVTMVWLDKSLIITTIVAIALGLSLNFLVGIVCVAIENNKVYVNKETKKVVKSLSKSEKLSSSFVFVNVMDMLKPNGKDTAIVKIIVSLYEKGKEKKRNTYYIDNMDDSINEMVKTICEMKNVKLYLLSDVEEEIKKLRKNMSIVFFNDASISKLVSESKNAKLYDNNILVSSLVSSSVKYKPYKAYMETIYSNNGLVKEKTDIMIDFYLSIVDNKDVVVKDLLNLGVK